MKIVVDAMGGDHAPKEIVLGALKACEDLRLDIILVGQESRISEYLTIPNKGSIAVVNAEKIITNEDQPVMAIRRKKDSSIVKGLNLVKEGRAQAFVSAGSTGALMAGGLFILGRFEGVDRPAIASVIPTAKAPTLFLDIGANSEVKPKNLTQFAQMGDIYAKEVLGRSNPKVGLLNIGIEEEKGNSIVKSAYTTLKAMEGINFIGNVEARAFFDGDVDVVVTDGFTGNIFLKTIEGFGNYIFSGLKKEIKSRATYSLGGMLLKPALKNIISRMDYSEYGGAMFLGLNGVLIKAHGSSKSKATFNAIRAAKQYHEAGIDERIKLSLKTNLEIML